MSDAVSTSSPQWVDVDFFHQALPALLPGGGQIGGMSSLSTDQSMLSPVSVDSSKMNGGSSPKNALKPIRRRSRASKRTPTTHLNASPTNFRALVQQFTGCPSGPSSLEAAKGPVTLHSYQYQLPAQQHQELYQQQLLHQQRISSFDNNDMNNAENGLFSSPNYMESSSGNFDADGGFLRYVPRDYYSSGIENFNNHGHIN